MTTLVRTVRRETAARIQGKTLCIEVTPWEVIYRQKGTRTRYAVPHDAAYHLGGRIVARERLAEKRKRR